MCGISGIFAAQLTEKLQQVNRAILASQTARGPDHQGELIINGLHSQIILGHNRLSIIDLANHSNQPMSDHSGRYFIVYNGEIYNYIELRNELIQLGHQFHTQSDTEVILEAISAWGIEALNRFHGPFAFAIYDQTLDSLWLCRDRFGVRPLYYLIKDNVLYFASTTNALAQQLNLKPNLDYVAQGLHYLVYEDGSDVSPYRHLQSLPGGCLLDLQFTSDGQLFRRQVRYYDLDKNVSHLIANLATMSNQQLLACVDEKLTNAVRMRLRSDVPLALSVSSGLDSSTVAAIVSQLNTNTLGFSFAHPEAQRSEGPLVAECAQYLQMNMHYVWPEAKELVAALDKTITAQDAPFSSLSIVAQFLLYEQVRQSGIKVLLGGQGGDEAFMGYKKFLLFWLQQSYQQRNYFSTVKNLLQLMPMLMAEMRGLKNYWQHRHRYFAKKQCHMSILNLPAIPMLSMQHSKQPLWKRQLLDITQFSLPTLLRYEDRNAMGNSVESRLPFLDHEVLELGLALPESIKLRGGYGKWAIREIMADKIPEKIRLARYKRGFDLSLPALIKSGLGNVVRASLKRHPEVNKEFLKPGINIDHGFSDHYLTRNKTAIAEAVTLLWLHKVTL